MALIDKSTGIKSAPTGSVKRKRRDGTTVTFEASQPKTRISGEPMSFSDLARDKKYGYVAMAGEKWYQGDSPTNRETIARIYAVSGDDNQKFSDLYGAYQQETKNRASSMYNPYAEATTYKAIEGLRDLGYDVSRIDDHFFKNYAWLKNEYRTTANGYGAAAPTKSSTDLQNAAYYYMQLLGAEERTKAAETELTGMADEVQYYADRGYSDAAIIQKVQQDFDTKYGTLAQMDADRTGGEPTLLNRATGYNSDTIYGMIFAARNGGGSGDWEMDAVNYTLGRGEYYRPDPRSEAAHDPTSIDYDPYSYGSNMDELNMRYDVESFGGGWLESNRGAYAATEDGQRDGATIERANANAAKGMSQLTGWRYGADGNIIKDETGADVKADGEGVDEWVQAQVARGRDAQEIIDELTAMLDQDDPNGLYNSDWAMLADMERARRRGAKVDIGFAVPFTLPNYARKIEEMCAERDAQTETAAETEAPAQTGNKYRQKLSIAYDLMVSKYGKMIGGADEKSKYSIGQRAYYDKALEAARKADETGDAKDIEIAEAQIKAYQEAMAIGSEEWRAGVAEQQKESGAYRDSYAWQYTVGAVGQAYAGLTQVAAVDSELDDDDIQRIQHMAETGIWDQGAYNAMARSVDGKVQAEAQFYDELLTGIELIISGRIQDTEKSRYWLAQAWVNEHAGMIAPYMLKTEIGEFIPSGGILGGHQQVFSYNDWETAYGTDIADALTALHDAQKTGAISNDTYLKSMIRMTEVCDAVQDVAQKEAKGDADAAAERIREQDGGEAFFSVVGDVRDMAENSMQQIEKANGLRRERSAAQGREVAAAVQNGTITQEQMDWLNENASGIHLEDVCKGDTGYQTAVSAAEELLSTQLTDGLANGSIRAAIDRDYMYSGKFNAFSMGEENIAQDKAFALMSTGIGGLIRRDLNQDMLMAEICGMTLDDYYEAYPARDKSPEARVQAATEEYMHEWMDASDAFTDMLRLSDLTQATESIARSGGKMEVEEKLRERDAALAEDGDDSRAYVDPILSTFEGFVGGFANVVVVGTENFLIWAGNSFTSGNEDISDRLYDKYNGDAAAYVKDLKEYAEINPAMHDYIYAALDSNLNAFDIVVPGAGVSLGIAGAKVQDQETFAQSSRYIAENGSAAVQFIYETANMLGSTAAMMTAGSVGQTAGQALGVSAKLSAKLSTMVTELSEATGVAVDAWENGGDWNAAQHTVIPLAAVLGGIEGNQLTARLGNMIQGNGLAGLLARGRQEAGLKGLVTGLLKQPGETMKTLMAGAQHMLGEGINNAIEEVLQDASQFLTEEGIQAASGNQSVMEAINNTFIGHLDDYIHTFLITMAGEPFMELGFGIAGKMSGVQMDAYDMDASAPIADQVAAAEQSTVNGYSDARATNAWLDADAIQTALVQEQDAITALAQGAEAAAVTEAQANAEAAHTDWLARRREENEASALWTEATNRLSELTEQVIDSDVIEPGMVSEMRDAQVAADHASERYSAAQAATQQAELTYLDANDALGAARAASKAQFDALMQPAIEAARQRALDNATRGMSDAEKARTVEYLDLDRQLADAEKNIREAERSAKDAPTGSDIERRAKSALVAARRIYDQITERMTEIFETMPAAEDAAEDVRTAEAEAQTPAAVAEAQQAAQEAADAASADPTNARLQAEADIAAKNLALAQAQAQLDAERGGIAEGLRGSAQDRAAAVEKHRTLSGAVEAAASDLKAAQNKNARVDRTQQELADAIADLQNYSDDDLRNPDSENYGAAVAAEARLTQATRAADVAAAEAGVRDALSALDANNPDSISAYRDALVRRTEVYQADLELTERQKAEIDRHVVRVAEGSQRAQAILEARQRGDREQAANLLAAAWNESEGSTEVRAMLRAAAGIRTNASEVTIQNETGATGKAGLTRAYSESAFKLSEDDQMQLQVLDALAQDGNFEIVAHPTVSTVPGARNGVYFAGNTIHIGLDAIDHAYVQTAFHEVVHWLRGNNADGYNGVAQTVLDALANTGEDVDGLIRDKLNAYAQAGEMLDYTAAQEEVVAESAALVLSDRRNMRAFARAHADAFSAFRDAFVRFWERLQNIARSVAGKNKTGEQQALIGQSKALQKIYDVLMDAVKATGEMGEQQDSVSENAYTSYSLNELSDDQKYSYAALTAKPDLNVVPLDANISGRTRDEVIAKALADAEKHASGHDQNNAPMVYVRDIEKHVIIGKKGIEHGLGGARFKAQAAVIEKVGEILSNSISVNEAIPKKNGVRNTWILMGVAQDSNGIPVYVRSIINQSTGHLENVSALYAVNGKKNEAGHNKNVPNAWDLSLGVSSSSTMSVADMLDAVKDKFSDVLSEDVVSTLGIERKTGEFTPNLKYSLNPAIIDDYNREQFVNTAVEQIMERGSRAPAIMRALAQMDDGAEYAYAPNGGTGGGGEYAGGLGSANPNGAGADGRLRDMRNPIEITTDLVRSVNTGLNPGGAKTLDGRTRMPRAVAGFYVPAANYITTDRRYAGQLAVNLHEFGHAISQTQDFNSVPPGYDAEYAAFLSQYPAESRGQEAIAAFAADYLVEPQRARNIAGDAYVDDFEAMLRANPRLNAAVQKARTEIDLWKSATVAERVANSIRDADEAEARSTARSRSLIRRFYGAVFDAADVAKDVGNDLYTAVRYANASSKRADMILTDRLVDYQGNRVGDSLAEVLRKAGIHQDNEMDMLTYAVARHAIEWYNEGLARRAENPNASGMEVFADGEISINDLRMLVAEYERTNPTAVQGADALVNWWRDFRDTWYVGTGLMTEKMAQELDRKYPNYVPFNRITEKQFGRRGSGRFSIRTARGSTLNIVNPIQSIAKNVASVVNTVSQNEVMRTLYDAYYAQDGGEATFGDLVTPAFEGREHVTQDVSGANAAVAAMVAAGADANLAQDAYAAIGRLGEIWRTTGQGAGANVVGGIDRNGNRFFFQIHDQALFNLLSGSAATMHDGLRVFRAWKNGFTKLTTGSNPLFAVKNLSRDFQASVNTGTWALTYIDGAVKEIRSLFEVLRKSETFEEWRAMGGGDHNRYNAESRSDTRDLRNALLGVERNGEIREHTPVRERITNLLTWERLNNAIENASRYAEYRFGRHDLSTFEGKREAFLASQDVTTDFSRMGSSAAIRTLCAVVPFMNATLQGTAKDINTIKNLGSKDAQTRARAWEAMGKSVLNIGLTAALQAALIGAFGGGDDDDEKRKEYGLLVEEMRAGNLVFRLPQEMLDDLGFDRPWVRIPMAQGPLAGALYSLALNAMSGVSGADELSVDLKATAQRMIGDCLDFSPIWQGVSDMLNNNTWYGSKIVSDYLAKSSVQNQYKGDTPALFKFLANAAHNIGIDVAPAALQYVAEQYTGFAGKILIPLMSGNRFTGEYSAEDSLRNLGYAIAKNYTIDPQTSNDVTNAYSDAKATLTSIKTDADNGNPIGALAYSLEPDEVRAAVREAERLTSGSGAIGKADKELRRLLKESSAERNSDHSDGEKAIALREIQKEMNTCRLAALEAYEEYCLKYLHRDGLATEVFHLFSERPRL